MEIAEEIIDFIKTVLKESEETIEKYFQYISWININIQTIKSYDSPTKKIIKEIIIIMIKIREIR